MPGLAGIVNRVESSCSFAALQSMLRALSRSPTDQFSEVSNPHDWLHFGSVSRADFDSDPVIAWNPARTVGLLFSGEEYSVAGEASTRATFAEALLAAYLRRGLGFLAELNGVFSGLLIDRRTGTATLFNDRYGLGRVYYHEHREGYYFASEAKALLAVLPQLRAIDQRGFAEFFATGCVLQNRTLFRDINVLPPASAWTFNRDGSLTKQRYFDPSTWEQQAPLSAEEYRHELAGVFQRAMHRCLKTPRSIGISLTGGLDSRAVIAWTKASTPLPCYTFGGPYRNCADVKIARRLASLCGLPHTTIPVGSDFFPDFETLARRSVLVSDGTMDVTGAVELHVNRLAREIAPVRLTGNYGSEILRSHIALRLSRLDRTPFTPEFCAQLDQAAATYEQERQCARLTFIAFKQMPWHHVARLSVEKDQLTPRSPFVDNEVVALAFRAPEAQRTSAEPVLDLIARGNPAFAAVGTDQALRQGGSPLVSRIAAGWQAFTVKAEYAYDYGMPQWLARTDHLLTPFHLERLFLGHHKFYHFRVWYRDQLRHYVRQQIVDRSIEVPCYKADAVRQLAQSHLAGQANHTVALHKALTVRLIEELFLKQT